MMIIPDFDLDIPNYPRFCVRCHKSGARVWIDRGRYIHAYCRTPEEARMARKEQKARKESKNETDI